MSFLDRERQEMASRNPQKPEAAPAVEEQGDEMTLTNAAAAIEAARNEGFKAGKRDRGSKDMARARIAEEALTTERHNTQVAEGERDDYKAGAQAEADAGDEARREVARLREALNVIAFAASKFKQTGSQADSWEDIESIAAAALAASQESP